MSWAKIEDRFSEHPKFEQAGPLALIIQIRAICYATRYRTNGHIPLSIFPQLIRGFDGIGVFTGHGGGEDADKLDWPTTMLESGLWDQAEGGWSIHDYLDYNPSKYQAEQLIKDRKKAGKIGAKTRWETEQKREQKPSKDADTSDWLMTLRSNPIYAHVDWDLEMGKMKVWQNKPANRKRQITETFVINWVNKIERPLSNGHAAISLTCPTHPHLTFPDKAAKDTHDFIHHPKYVG